MTRSGAAPLGEQLAIVLLGPPIMAALVWFMSRGWALSVQAGVASDRTKRRQRVEFWMVLALMYSITIGMAVYTWLT
jgi:hypothetical protein